MFDPLRMGISVAIKSDVALRPPHRDEVVRKRYIWRRGGQPRSEVFVREPMIKISLENQGEIACGLRIEILGDHHFHHFFKGLEPGNCAASFLHRQKRSA